MMSYDWALLRKINKPDKHIRSDPDREKNSITWNEAKIIKLFLNQ